MIQHEGRRSDSPTLIDLAREAARTGRASAALLGRCRSLVRAIILDRVTDPDVADDLTQDALVDVTRSIGKLRDAQSFSAWVRRIAINRCKMWWRRPLPEPGGLDGYHHGVVHEDAFAQAARRETWREVRRALSDLPEQSRLALLMHAVEGASYAEIAQALDASIASVGVRIHRSRARLRSVLGLYADRPTKEEQEDG